MSVLMRIAAVLVLLGAVNAQTFTKSGKLVGPATIPVPTGITFIGGTTVQCALATTCTITYTPTSTSNEIAVCLATTNTITAPSVVDNAGTPVTLTAGSQVLGSAPNTAIFYYQPGSGVTQFTANWTTARASSLGVVEYSAVTLVTGTPSSGTNNGSSTTPTVAPVANEVNDVAVGCLSRNSATNPSELKGHMRKVISASSPALAIVDLISNGATATTLSVTTSSGLWTGSALMLRP